MEKRNIDFSFFYYLNMKSLKESLFDDDLISNGIEDIIDPKYIHPKDKIELTKSIKYYIELTNPKKGDTIDLNWIDTSKIKIMSFLFFYLDEYNYDISKWDVSKVRIMDSMFFKCPYFNCDLSKWDVRNVENMEAMFFGCTEFNSDLSKWNVSKVENMNQMFYNCHNFDSNLSKWDVSNCIFTDDVFNDCPKMKEKNKPHFK